MRSTGEARTPLTLSTMAHEYDAMQQMIRTYATNDQVAIQPLGRLRAAVARWEGLNLTLFELCRRSGARYGTVQRWLRGEQEPAVSRYEETVAAFEAAIASEEARLRARLEAAS